MLTYNYNLTDISIELLLANLVVNAQTTEGFATSRLFGRSSCLKPSRSRRSDPFAPLPVQKYIHPFSSSVLLGAANLLTIHLDHALPAPLPHDCPPAAHPSLMPASSSSPSSASKAPTCRTRKPGCLPRTESNPFLRPTSWPRATAHPRVSGGHAASRRVSSSHAASRRVSDGHSWSRRVTPNPGPQHALPATRPPCAGGVAGAAPAEGSGAAPAAG